MPSTPPPLTGSSPSPPTPRRSLLLSTSTTNGGSDNTQDSATTVSISSKITAIQADRSGGGALGFLKVKYSGSDEWQFIASPEDVDGLWDWNDQSGDSDIITLQNHEFVTGIYWFNSSEYDVGAIQQIGFDIYNAITGTTTQTKLNTYSPTFHPRYIVDVFDESLSTTGAIKAESGQHILSFEGLAPCPRLWLGWCRTYRSWYRHSRTHRSEQRLRRSP